MDELNKKEERIKRGKRRKRKKKMNTKNMSTKNIKRSANVGVNVMMTSMNVNATVTICRMK